MSDAEKYFEVIDQHMPMQDSEYCACGATWGAAHLAAALAGDTTEFGVEARQDSDDPLEIIQDTLRGYGHDAMADALAGAALKPQYEYAIVTYYSAEGLPSYYPMQDREQAETWMRPWKDRTPWDQYPVRRRIGAWERIPRKDELNQVELEPTDG